jgi:DNA-binding transcriptional MerR regulator
MTYPGGRRVTKLDRSDARPVLAELVVGFAAGAASGRDVFTIRDLAKEFGISARTLRFYEEKGLVDPARRGEQRLYSRRDRARLAYVLAGKTVGFSLEEVREMLDLYDLGDGQVTQLKVALTKFGERIERLERQKTDIDRIVAELTRASDAMKAKLAARDTSVDHPPLQGEGIGGLRPPSSATPARSAGYVAGGDPGRGQQPVTESELDPHPASFARRPPPFRGR